MELLPILACTWPALVFRATAGRRKQCCFPLVGPDRSPAQSRFGKVHVDVSSSSEKAGLKGLPATLPELRQFLRENLAAGRREHFGNVRESWTATAEDYFWDEKHQNWRLDVLTRHGVQSGRHRVLDLSSGCGQFVLFALQR